MREEKPPSDPLNDEIEYWLQHSNFSPSAQSQNAKSVLKRHAQLKRVRTRWMAVCALSMGILGAALLPFTRSANLPHPLHVDNRMKTEELHQNPSSVPMQNENAGWTFERENAFANHVEEDETIREIERIQQETKRLKRLAIRNRLIAEMKITEPTNYFPSEDTR